MYGIYTHINNMHIYAYWLTFGHCVGFGTFAYRFMLNGIGQAYHSFNFLVGLHYYTTNTIRLCHESYFNIIQIYCNVIRVIDASY